MTRPKRIVCDRCDHATTRWQAVGTDWLCWSCVMATDDHTRWCSCGLMLAGSTRQVVAMAAVHWLHTGCRWALLTTNPREG